MAFQKVEFEFPDEDDNLSIDVEPSSAKQLDAEPPEKEQAKKPAKSDDEDDVEIEVVDDTPIEDRDREPSEPPEEVTDSELESYSDKVRKRIQRFQKGYHDERRARETAERERDELERVTRQLVEDNKRFKADTNKSQTALVEQAKARAQTDLDAAKRRFKEAYESGDSDGVTEAQDQLAAARSRLDRVNNLKVPPLQDEKVDVKQPHERETVQQEPEKPTPKRQLAPRVAEWTEENPWFGQDDEMTAFALGYHNKLVKEGVDPETEDYYKKLDARLRKVFPENFDEEVDDEPPESRQQKKPTSSVAPVTRSTAQKKVRLTKTQVAIANRLGVPLELYAKEVAEGRRNDNA